MREFNELSVSEKKSKLHSVTTVRYVKVSISIAVLCKIITDPLSRSNVEHKV